MTHPLPQTEITQADREAAEHCYRCGEPATQTWDICSLPGKHGVCTPCDIALNGLVLAFMRVPDAARRLRRYDRKMMKLGE